MDVTDRDLLAGEVVETSKKANAVVRYSDYGLERLGAMHAGLEAMGWGGKEGVGGKLHLTNYRLLFKAHGVNRLSGSLGVFLPSIDDVRDSSRGLVRRMTVATASQELEFVVWGVPGLMRAVVSDENASVLPSWRARSAPPRTSPGVSARAWRSRR